MHLSKPIMFDYRSAWTYFLITYGISWGCWIPAAMSGDGLSSGPILLLFYLGAAGPLLSGVSLTYLRGGVKLQRDYWQRVIDFKRIGRWWYAIIFLTMPALTVLSMYLTTLSGANAISSFQRAADFLARPLTTLPFAVGILAFGPTTEELGWRGYAQDRLQQRYNPLVSSLVVGLGWGLWHLPLYFIPGTFQYELSAGSTLFWLFTLSTLPQSVLMGWIFNANRRSTLSAILFHFSINFSGEFFAPSQNARTYQLVLSTAMAVIVAVAWKMYTPLKASHVDGQDARSRPDGLDDRVVD